MTTYPSIPADARSIPIPAAYDPRVRVPAIDDVLEMVTDQAYSDWVIESRARRPGTPHHPGSRGGRDGWQVRPGHEHRGGRSWLRHRARISHMVNGAWGANALVFYDRLVAAECLRRLKDADTTVEYRVREVRYIQRTGEIIS